MRLTCDDCSNTEHFSKREIYDTNVDEHGNETGFMEVLSDEEPSFFCRGCGSMASDRDLSIEQVRMNVGSVRVEVDGETHWFRILGRLDKFATLTCGHYRFEYSWEAVQRAHNNNTPLKAGPE